MLLALSAIWFAVFALDAALSFALRAFFAYYQDTITEITAITAETAATMAANHSAFIRPVDQKIHPSNQQGQQSYLCWPALLR